MLSQRAMPYALVLEDDACFDPVLFPDVWSRVITPLLQASRRPPMAWVQAPSLLNGPAEDVLLLG